MAYWRWIDAVRRSCRVDSQQVVVEHHTQSVPAVGHGLAGLDRRMRPIGHRFVVSPSGIVHRLVVLQSEFRWAMVEEEHSVADHSVRRIEAVERRNLVARPLEVNRGMFVQPQLAD